MKKYLIKSNIFIAGMLILMMICPGIVNAAGISEYELTQMLSKNGQWVVDDAWNSEGTTVDYQLSFFPDENDGMGVLIFEYISSSDMELNTWSGYYWLSGPADQGTGWVYQYSLYTNDGERSGTFILEVDGDNLVLTENTGDCFWAFTSNSTETLVFEEIMFLDGESVENAVSMEMNGNLDVHKQILLDTNSICGAIYLGYVDYTCESLADDRAYLEELLLLSGYTEDYDFLMNIPDDRIVEVDGGFELYCIYPRDEMATVSVNKYVVDENTYELVLDDILYRSDYGQPILLRCNATEVFYDAEVNIVDSYGNYISWKPGISMKDGKMDVPSEAPYVYDATWYGEEYDSYEDYTYEDYTYEDYTYEDDMYYEDQNFSAEDGPYLVVVNCEEWVSLRLAPDVNSERLAEVPLGSVVVDCGEAENGFYAVSYNGWGGFIKSDYLEVYQETDDLYENEYTQQASTYPVLMTYEEVQASEQELLNYTNGDFTVYAGRTWSEEDGEILKVGCFCNGEPMWGYISTCPYFTELDITEAFMAGSAQDPRVAIYNAESGMLMVDMFFGDILWEVSIDDLQVGGSICYYVTEDGVIYCTGYYDAGPTAISPDGKVIWRAQKSNPDIYWAYLVRVENDVVIVEYGTGNDVGNDVVAFNINDGMECWHEIKPY